MIKKLCLIFLVILLIIPFSFAKIDYNETGDFNTFFIRGTGVFNANLDPNADILTSTAIIANPKKVPLVSDLDGDGVQEIIVLNGININIFQNKSLDVASSITLNAPSTERFSNMITFDIDGDSLREIILVGEKRNLLHILAYNRSSFTVEQEINLTPVTSHISDESSESTSGLIIIGCESINRCLMAYADNQETGFTASLKTTNLFASFFNSTDIANERQIDTTGSGLDTFCPSKIRTMAKADYDQDVDVEFIFTFNRPDMSIGDAGDDISIYWVNILANNTPIEEIQTDTTEVTEITDPVSSVVDYFCDDSNDNADFRFAGGIGTALAGKFFTSPLVYDADPLSAGLETIIGVMIDNDEFSIIMYDQTGAEIREFPLIQDSEGQIVSNVFRAEVFDDSSSEQDFCVMAQQSTNGEQIAVTCGSLQDTDGHGTLGLQTIEFRSNTTFGVPFNISDDFDFHGIITHSGEHDSSNSESEAVTSYGILELDPQTGLGCGDIFGNNCRLNRIFAMPQINGAVIPVDLDNIDLEDMIVLTSTNLFYLDDGFENVGVNAFCGEPDSVTGTCSEYTTNPCIDSVWRINTSVEITVTGIDPESDLVQVSATLYDGDVNEQSQTSGNVSSETTVPFSFIANKTIGAGTLTITAVDIIENPSDIKTVTKTFSVAPTGVEFGDCKTNVNVGVIDVDAPIVILNATITTDATDNSVVTGIQTFSNISGLAGTTVWLILMVAITLAIWFRMAEVGMGGNSALGTIAIFNIIMIILGARVGILSTGLVVIITVLGVVIIGVFLGRFLTGLRTGGGVE